MIPFINTVFLEILLLIVCYLGDTLLQHPVVKQQFVVALTDSLTHGIVGGISWAIVCDLKFKKQECLECILCLVLAMLVDTDHFLSARSFSLKAALSLPARPPFHATTLVILVDITLVIVAAILKSQNLILGAMIFTTAWVSHHVRDGHRRGLWFYPFGETAAIPKPLYLGIILAFPLLMKILHLFFDKQRLKDKTIILSGAQLV
ncbi:transmembrane protein 267-like [Mercenaria mercenaria]|uniref:transmembrane protein 267-like n=1 Tax=Mercenaria mercenaria TaxID=6596 RepID=UPI00234F33F2|nr:transmembrane protein 267-like [Mercenaria mercenaria]